MGVKCMSGVHTPNAHFIPTYTFRAPVPGQLTAVPGPDLDHLGLFWCVGFVFVLVMGGLGFGFG